MPALSVPNTVRQSANLDLELLIMDDSSPDDTPAVVAREAKPWVKLIVRTSNRGLSPAVIDGLKAATNPVKAIGKICA